MKKRFFDAGLFRDGMKQLRVGGLVAALVLGLQAVLLPIGQVMENTQPGEWEYVRYFQMIPLNVLLFTCIAPLMALWLFRFLSQRNASDFYHAIPQTRACLYISFTASVLCWALLLQVGATALASVVFAAFPARFHIVWSDILLSSVQMFACVLFVVGAVMLAVTLTGNALTNLAVSLLIIFFPRLVMLVVKLCVGGSLTVVNENYLSFMGNNWNVVTGTMFSLFDGASRLFISLRAGAYTAGIGMLYLILGGVMFCRRRSEAAGQASIGPRLQLMFRLLPAAVFCLIPSTQVFQILVGSSQATRSELYGIFVLYLVSVIIYFLYELISTRKVRNLAKAIPGLGLLLCFNLLAIFGMMGMRRMLLSYSPSGDQIESVQLVGEQRFIRDADGSGEAMPGYFSSRASHVQLDSPEVRDLIAARLAETVAYDNAVSPDKNSETADARIREVAIHSGGRVHFRNVMLLQSDVVKLAEALKESEEIRRIYMELPEAGTEGLTLSFAYVNTYSAEGLELKPSPEELAEIYTALRRDAETMGFERWYAYCQGAEEGEYTLYMKENLEGDKTGAAFPIDEENTPEAWRTAQQICWELEAPLRERLLTELQTIAAAQEKTPEALEISYSDCYVTVCDSRRTGEAPYYEINLVDAGELSALCDLMEKQKDMPLDPARGYLSLNANLEYYAGEAGEDRPKEAEELQPSVDYRSFYGTLILAFPEQTDFRVFMDYERGGHYQSETDGVS